MLRVTVLAFEREERPQPQVQEQLWGTVEWPSVLNFVAKFLRGKQKICGIGIPTQGLYTKLHSSPFLFFKMGGKVSELLNCPG